MNRNTKISGLRRAADARNRIFSAMRRAHRLPTPLLALAGAVLAAAPSARANPKGGQVSGGSAVITQTNPSRLDIVQSTDRAAIDWQSFNIAPNEQTNFQQPAATSMTLNRVAPGDPSVIAGRLTANGQIVLVNPSGITFSKGAVVDVNSIVATPTDISNANFMAGRMRFDKPSADPRAAVVNQGSITVAQKGLAALVGPAVANSGVIQAKLAKVVLAGAQTYTVDFYGDGLISFDVGPKVTTVPTGPDGQPVKSLVSHTGQIDAPGGTVLLTADAAAGIIGNVVDARGRITAQTNGPTPGSVTIDSGPGGGANLSGTIDVSGLNPGQKGGSATMTGGSVALASTARIDARGDAGGGAVRIGGNFHGAGPQRNATTTYVEQGALITADAVTNGDGGQVAVWSDGSTVFNGSISAQGGTQGGNGGFIETSSKGTLIVGPTAVVSAAAPYGTAGQWLLDPDSNIDIATGEGNITCSPPAPCTPPADSSTLSASTINNALTGGTSVTVTTSNPTGTQPGNITVDAPLGPTIPVLLAANAGAAAQQAVATTLTLSAGAGGGAGMIAINQPITDVAGQDNLSLVLNAGGNIAFNNTVNIHGNLTATAGTHLAGATITQNQLGVLTVAGSSSFTDQGADGTITLTNGSNALAGPVSLNTLGANGNASLTNNVADGTILAASSVGGNLTVTANGNLTQSGALTAGGSQLTLRTGTSPTTVGSGEITINGSVDSGTGLIELDAGTGGILINGSLTSMRNINQPANTGVFLFSTGSINEVSTASISVPYLIALTRNDKGGPIALEGTANQIDAVTLTTLNAPANPDTPVVSPGLIHFVDGKSFQIFQVTQEGDFDTGLKGLEFGINTTSDAFLLAASAKGSASITGNVKIAAQNLVVRTQQDGGAAITLANPDNEVPGNVTLSALNFAGTAPAPGAISFVDSTGFTVAAQPQNGLNGQEIGVNTTANVNLQSSGALRIFEGAIDAGSAPINVSASSIQLNSNNIPCGNGFTGCDINTTGSVTLLATTGDATEDFGIVNASSLTVSAPKGTVQFDGPVTNGVGSVTGTATNSFQFVNCCSFTVAGVSTSAGDIRLRTTPLVPPGAPADITLTQNVVAGGGKNNAALVATGNLLESGGSVTASGLIANAGEAATLTGANAVVTLSGSAGTSFEFVNAGSLTLANVPKVVDVGPQAGVTATNGNVELATTVGDLTISSNVTAAGGGVLIGVGGGGSLNNNGTVKSTGPGFGGNTVILADAMNFAQGSNITAGADSAVVLAPFTPTNAIALGTQNSKGTLGLTGSELGTVTAGLLQIGYFGETGNIDLASAITINAGQTPNLALVTGGAVSQAPAATLDYPGGRLGVIAGNSVTLDQSNVVDILAGVVNNPSQNFQFTDGGANLTVGSLTAQQVGVSIDVVTNFPVPSPAGTGSKTNPISGVTAATSGNIVLQTAGDNLMLTQPVTAGDGIVGLASAGTITQDPGPIIASSLAILSADRVSLGAFGGPNDLNQVGTLAAQVLGAGQSFVFRNDAKTLTIGTVILPPPLTLSVGPVSVGTLSGVVTNNANLGLRVTSSGDLLLMQNVAAGRGGAIGLESAGAIRQTGGVVTGGTLEVSALGSVGLPDANMVPTLAGRATGAGNSFQFRDDGQTLTVGTVPTLLETGTNAPPNSQMLSVAGLSGVATNNANLGLRVTGSGDLLLAQNVSAGSAGVGLESAGQILQTGGAVTANTLEISAVEAVSLADANMVAQLAGQVTGSSAPNSFLYRNDGVGLTVGTLPTLLETGAGAPPNSRMLNVAGLSGMTTNGGNIILETTTAGDLALSQSVNANNGSLVLGNSTGSLGLASAGTITQSATGFIVASDLEVFSQERVSLGAFVGPTDQAAPNVVARLAGQVVKAGESFVFRSEAESLTIGTTVDVKDSFGMRLSALASPLTGVTTSGANIGLRATGSKGLDLAANVSANGGGIGLESGGPLQMAGPLSGTVAISAVGPVSLSASAPVVLSAQITGAGNSFQFVDNGATLTIGLSDLLREQGAETPPNNQMLSIGGLVGVATNNGNILLQTTKNGDLVLNQSVNAGMGSATLTSAGTITEQPGGTITAGTLTGSSAGNASFSQVGNLVTNLGAFTTTTGGNNGNFTLTNGQPLNITGSLNAGTGAVMLNSAGTITEQSGGTITAGTLSGNSVGGASLTQANLVGTFGPFDNTTSGLLSFTDAQPLTTGEISSAGGVTLTTTGAGSNLTLGANLTAPGQTVTLNSTGTITEQSGGAITAQNLTARTQSDAGAALTLTNSANDIPGNVTLSALNSAGTAPAAGNIDFVDSAGFTVAAQPANGLNGQEVGVNTSADVTMQAGGDFFSTGGGSSTLAVGGMISSGAGVIALAAGTGGIPISGSIARAGSTAPTSTGLGLFSTGPIIESPTATISVPYLLALTENDAGAPIALTGAGNSVGAVTLSTLNGPGNLAGPVAAPGKISFTDSNGFQILPVTGIENFNRDLMVLKLTPAEVSALTPQLFGINTTSDVNLTTLNNGSNLVLGGNLSAPGHMVTLTSAGSITEVNDPVIMASGLTVGAAGKVSLGIDGGTVFPANANMVGSLTGSAGGSFGFLNATALTVGAVNALAGDVLIQVNNAGQPLTLAGNINVSAAGRLILDTAGGFSQTGTATVNAPVLAIDTTGSGVNTLLGFITSPSVNASVVSSLPPAGKTSNPIQFGNLSAPNSVVLLFADQGSVAGPIQAGQLGLSGTGSLADLQGTINGVGGPTAALLGVRAPGPEPAYLFNDCIIAAATCVVIPPNQTLAFLVTQPQTASEIQALSVSPNLSAQFVLIEPEIVKGVRQSENPDAPVINIFDEERLCDETAKSGPTKEPCREER